MKLTSEVARQLLDYDPATGVLTWKFRGRHWFASESTFKSWNTKYCGKEALTANNKFGYCVGLILRKQVKSHRVIWLIMTGEWPDQIDHINGIKNDNRWCNLRSVSNSENGRNQKLNSVNKSGVIGVSQINNKWCARIKVNGQDKHLGHFETFDAACEMRSVAERNYLFHANHGRI